MTPNYDIDPRELIARLESRWQPQYRASILHGKIVHSLKQLKKELARDSEETRMVLRVYSRSLHGDMTSEELLQANHALKHIIAELGLFILAALPLGFLTLPAILALAQHYGVDLGLHRSDEQSLTDVPNQ